MKKSTALGLFLCLALMQAPFAAETPPTTLAPQVTSEPTIMPVASVSPASPAAVLFDTTTRQFLFDKAGDTPMFPASTTKVLTALIILQDCKLTDPVTIPNSFVNPGGSHIALDHGEVLTVEQLLHAALIESANDAAAALAIHHSGSIEAFAAVMNERAKKLGATHSNFVNPHGLHNANHVSTAKDLALIAAEAMKNATFRDIVKLQRYTIPPTNKKTEAREYLRTSNRFIRDTGNTMNYKGKNIPIFDATIDGIKTGYTTEANNCLISSKLVNGNRLITVVLGAGVDNMVYLDSKLLLDYGESSFKAERFVSEGEVVANIKVPNATDAGLNLVAKETLTRTIAADSTAKIERVISYYDLPKEPIVRGTPLGSVKFTSGGKVLATTELLAERDVAARDLLGDITLTLSTKNVLDSPVDIAIIGGKLLLSFTIWRWIIVRRNQRIRKKARQEKLSAIRQSMGQEDQKKL